MPTGCEGRVCRSSCDLRTVRAGLVEALVCWFGKHAWVQGGGRESPGRRVTFFRVAERKSPKKGRPPVCDPCASLRGKPASGRLRGAPQNSLRACGAPLGQLRRVRSRSIGAPTPMPPHNRPAAGAASRGWTAEQPNSHTGHCCARPHLRSAWRLRPRDGAERSNGPCGCPLGPLHDAPRSAGRGAARASKRPCFVL